MSHNIVGSVGCKAQEFDNTCHLNLSGTILCTLCRERKKAAAQLHRKLRLSLQWGCLCLRVRGQLFGFWILLAFKTEEDMQGGRGWWGIYNDNRLNQSIFILYLDFEVFSGLEKNQKNVGYNCFSLPLLVLLWRTFFRIGELRLYLLQSS